MSTTSTFRASGPATDELSAGAEQFTVSGGDWDDVVARIAERDEADRLRNDRFCRCPRFETHCRFRS